MPTGLLELSTTGSALKRPPRNASVLSHTLLSGVSTGGLTATVSHFTLAGFSPTSRRFRSSIIP
ncbi:Uncharacterised protein [uncultured archaeon]|nr:Uncharacterised protein [uncultured archaeon]